MLPFVAVLALSLNLLLASMQRTATHGALLALLLPEPVCVVADASIRSTRSRAASCGWMPRAARC
jgi:uncharacterized membrane protein YfbV (UPF0208 family)